MEIEPQGPDPARHPINELLELIGRRWALRVLWELRDGALPYRRLREACDHVSTSVLSQRLRELVDAGVLEHRDGAYAPTPLGEELTGHLLGLNDWARRWAAGRGGR